MGKAFNRKSPGAVKNRDGEKLRAGGIFLAKVRGRPFLQ